MLPIGSVEMAIAAWIPSLVYRRAALVSAQLRHRAEARIYLGKSNYRRCFKRLSARCP